MTSVDVTDTAGGFDWARAAVFILSGVASLTLTLGLYVGFVSQGITKSDVPSTYKWFLLSELPGPRLIIESGSNGHHSLDTDAISEALNITAINIADNGGYDLEQKAARLAKNTRPGDVVVLPLEWVFYTRSALTDDFVDNLPGLNRDYFNSVGWIDQVRLALSLPPSSEFEFRQIEAKTTMIGDLSPIQALYISALTQTSGHTSFENARPLAPGVSDQSCDSYIFGPGPYEISSKFKKALAKFAKLQKSGIEVVFAWPVMVGDECFVADTALHDFAEEIERAVEDKGLHFIGRPGDAVYPSRLRDDTPYHLVRAGTDEHTSRFVDLLRNHGIGPAGTQRDIRAFATARLYELERQTASASQLLPFPAGASMMVEDVSVLEYVDFVAGWWGHEPYGRWMRDHEAVLRLQVPQELAPGTDLVLSGAVAGGGSAAVQALINGRVVAPGTLGAGNDLRISLDAVPRGEVLELILRFPDAGPAQSPYDRGETEDRRTLTFHLKTLAFMDRSEAVQLIPIVNNQREQTASNEAVSWASNRADLDISFDDQWWDAESNRRWMKCCEAALTLRLSEGAGDVHAVEISGGLFGGGEARIVATLNDQPPMQTVFSRGKPLRLPVDRSTLNGDLKIVLQFPDRSFQSPKVMRLSNDARVMSAFIEDIRLIDHPVPAL